jgi:uncharacterized protein DUF4864
MNHIAKSSLLLFFFSLCAAAVVVTHDVDRYIPAPRTHELYSVVNSQLAAFRASDFSRAYRNASSAVQQKFSLAQFENMIRRDYSAMTETHRVEFGFVQVQGATALVPVLFFAGDGSVCAFLYNLVAEDGRWKIEGVETLHLKRARQSGLHV